MPLTKEYREHLREVDPEYNILEPVLDLWDKIDRRHPAAVQLVLDAEAILEVKKGLEAEWLKHFGLGLTPTREKLLEARPDLKALDREVTLPELRFLPDIALRFIVNAHRPKRG